GAATFRVAAATWTAAGPTARCLGSSGVPGTWIGSPRGAPYLMGSRLAAEEGAPIIGRCRGERCLGLSRIFDGSRCRPHHASNEASEYEDQGCHRQRVAPRVPTPSVCHRELLFVFGGTAAPALRARLTACIPLERLHRPPPDGLARPGGALWTRSRRALPGWTDAGAHAGALESDPGTARFSRDSGGDPLAALKLGPDATGSRSNPGFRRAPPASASATRSRAAAVRAGSHRREWPACGAR